MTCSQETRPCRGTRSLPSSPEALRGSWVLFNRRAESRALHTAFVQGPQGSVLCFQTAQALTWMAGTRVKYPIRMIPSSVAMFFIIDQLSLLRPGEKTCRQVKGDCSLVNGREQS